MRNNKKMWICRILLFFTMVICSAALSVSAAEKVDMMTKKKIVAQAGEKYKLRLPKDLGEIRWSSSNPGVATVNKKGTVKTKKKGKAVITAQTDKAVYQCKVKVKQPVKEISFDRSIVVIKQGSTEKLNVSVKPSNASNKQLIWSSDNTVVATVDAQGTIKGHKTGVAVITAKAKDGSGVTGSCRITVTSSPLKMKQTSVTLTKGESAKLKVKGTAGMTIGWGSGNKSIVSVLGNGSAKATIKAVGVGSTLISAYRLEDGQKVYCKVTVKEDSSQKPSGDDENDSDDDQQQDSNVRPPASGVSQKAQQLLVLMQKYSDRVKKDALEGKYWTYANSGVSTTWKTAKNKNRKCNCALLARWGLRDLGVINSLNFWGVAGGDIVYRGDVKDQLLRYCDIIPVYKTPKQLLAEGNLLPGDICTYVDYAHTNVYAGDGLWYDAGRGANYNRSTGAFNSFGPGATINMSGTTISYIIRLR